MRKPRRFTWNCRAIAWLGSLLLPAGGAFAATTFSLGAGQLAVPVQPTASLTVDEFTLKMTAGPSGAVLSQVSTAGMGILSRSLSDVVDPNNDKFDLLGGTAPESGMGEYLEFSFDRPGVLTGIDFDGVKDESLEYFILETPSGERINFFDSAADTTIPGAVTSAVNAGDVTGEVVFLLEINAAVDDEAQNLHLPFPAGGAFRLTYAELDARFGTTEIGNGSRLQGITVETVPEPATVLLFVVGSALAGVRRRGVASTETC